MLRWDIDNRSDRELLGLQAIGDQNLLQGDVVVPRDGLDVFSLDDRVGNRFIGLDSPGAKGCGDGGGYDQSFDGFFLLLVCASEPGQADHGRGLSKLSLVVCAATASRSRLLTSFPRTEKVAKLSYHRRPGEGLKTFVEVLPHPCLAFFQPAHQLLHRLLRLGWHTRLL